MTTPVSPEPAEPLPELVRQRVLRLAADALGAMAAEDVPSTLRPFHRFQPQRRARLAATPIAAALEHDPLFLEHVGEWVRAAVPDLAGALDAGLAPPAADPLDVAAVAYLVRPEGWPRWVEQSARAAEGFRRAVETAQAAESVSRLQEQLTALRAQSRSDLERVKANLAAAREEVATLRRAIRESAQTAQRAEAAAREASAAADRDRAEATARVAAAELEARRLRSRATTAEAALETARTAARADRGLADTRLRLLLDTVVDAASGLRRELALPPADVRPGDAVEAVRPDGSGAGAAPPRAQASDDPAVLDQLLALPRVHLIVDGYNVTMAGYGTLPLEAQRSRLITGLAGLAARSGAEVTCCFDGALLDAPVTLTTPRGVRVLFSRPGETADELIRRLVRAEPPGRQVVVVSSDREVADGVRRAGARALAATALLRRLDRG